METNNRIQNTWCAISSSLYIATILILIFTQRGCLGLDKNEIVQPSEVKSDTITKYVYNDKWYPVYLKAEHPKDSIIQPIPTVIDTEAILNIFYKSYQYCDTIKDSNIIAVNNFYIAQNKLKEHSFTYKLLQPSKETIITNTIIAKNKSHFLVGLNVNLNKNTILGISPECLYLTKKQMGFGVGYDVLNNYYSVKVYYPLNFSNPK